MNASLGIYALTVKAHIHSSACNPAYMLKKHDVGSSIEEKPLSPTDEIVRANIRRLMDQHGIINGNQSELARKAFIDQTFISKFLKGKSSVSLNSLHRIADALGVPSWALLVPGEWELANCPALQPLTESEKQLYEKIRETAVLAAEVGKENKS